MPPEENTNKNIPNLDTFKVGIDPVFKTSINQQKPSEQNAPASVYNVLNNQQYTPSQQPIPEQKPIEINPNAQKSIIRTYKGDLESAIQTEHLSSINIAIAENQKMREQIIEGGETKVVSTESYSKNKIIIFISLALVIVGVIGIFATYLLTGSSTQPVVQTQELPSLITTEYKDELNVNSVAKNKFIGVLSSKLNESNIPVNSFYNTYITAGTSTTKRLVNSSEFVTLANFTMPDIIKRSLLPDFMVGTYSFGKNLPFVIFKESSFENAYAGMFEWEKYLEKDFQQLFRLSGYENPGGILAELASSNINKFTDSVIANKDVRLIRDEKGQITLLYGIIDKETIVITVNSDAFKEIINRLNKEKGLQR